MDKVETSGQLNSSGFIDTTVASILEPTFVTKILSTVTSILGFLTPIVACAGLYLTYRLYKSYRKKELANHFFSKETFLLGIATRYSSIILLFLSLLFLFIGSYSNSVSFSMIFGFVLCVIVSTIYSYLINAVQLNNINISEEKDLRNLFLKIFTNSSLSAISVSAISIIFIGFLFYFYNDIQSVLVFVAFALGVSLYATVVQFDNSFCNDSSEKSKAIIISSKEGANIFESYMLAVIATIVIGALLPERLLPQVTNFQIGMDASSFRYSLMVMPILISLIGYCSTFFAIKTIQLTSKESLMKSLTQVLLLALAFFLIGTFVIFFFSPILLKVWFVIVTLSILVFVYIKFHKRFCFESLFSKEVEQEEANGLSSFLTIITGALIGSIAPSVFVVISLFFASYFAGWYGLGIASVSILAMMPVFVSFALPGNYFSNVLKLAEIESLELEKIVIFSKTSVHTYLLISGLFVVLTILSAFSLVFGGINASVFDISIITGLFLSIIVIFIIISIFLLLIKELRGKSTNSIGFYEKITPLLVILLSPVIIGFSFGSETLAGFLLGTMFFSFLLANILANGLAVCYATASNFTLNLDARFSRKDQIFELLIPVFNILCKVVAIVALLVSSML